VSHRPSWPGTSVQISFFNGEEKAQMGPSSVEDRVR
jgi:hypothetical protein